jgi:hypothetical protein
MSDKIRAGQLVDKTITLEKNTPFYRVSDVNNLGYKSKEITPALKTGYKFVVDSFLLKGPAYTNPVYGLRYEERKDDYLTFRGRDGNFYAIKVKDLKLSKEGRQASGILTIKEEQEAQQSTLQKIIKFGRNLIIGVAVVWAAGYIYKTTKK